MKVKQSLLKLKARYYLVKYLLLSWYHFILYKISLINKLVKLYLFFAFLVSLIASLGDKVLMNTYQDNFLEKNKENLVRWWSKDTKHLSLAMLYCNAATVSSIGLAMMSINSK